MDLGQINESKANRVFGCFFISSSRATVKYHAIAADKVLPYSCQNLVVNMPGKQPRYFKPLTLI